MPVKELFVPLDVNQQFNRKILAAGPWGELLYNRGLQLVKRTLSDGYIDVTQLAGLCANIPGKPAMIAQRCVDADLWAVDGNGWRTVGWLKRNKSKQAINESSEKKAANAAKGCHVRYHVNTGEPDDNCPFCEEERSQTPSQTRSQTRSSERSTETEPKPETETETLSSSSGSELTTGRDQHPSAAAAQPSDQHSIVHATDAQAFVDFAIGVAVSVRLMQSRGRVTDPEPWCAQLARSIRLKHGADWHQRFTEHPDTDAAAMVAVALRLDTVSCHVEAAKIRQRRERGGAA